MMDDTRRFTDDLDKATILGAIARGWCHEENVAKEMDGDLAGAIADEVEQVITALRAQVEALGRDLNMARYGEPHFGWEMHKAAMADLQDQVAALTAERDAIAAVTVAACAEKIRSSAGLYVSKDAAFICDSAAFDIEALSPLDPVKAAAGVQGLTANRVEHIKRGSTYRELGRGQIQTDRLLSDYTDVVVYQCEEDGRLWVRPTDEFEDAARFRAIAEGGE